MAARRKVEGNHPQGVHGAAVVVGALEGWFYRFRRSTEWVEDSSFAWKYQAEELGLPGIRTRWLASVTLPVHWRSAMGLIEYLNRQLFAYKSRCQLSAPGTSPRDREVGKDRTFPRLASDVERFSDNGRICAGDFGVVQVANRGERGDGDVAMVVVGPGMVVCQYLEDLAGLLHHFWGIFWVLAFWGKTTDGVACRAGAPDGLGAAARDSHGPAVDCQRCGHSGGRSWNGRERLPHPRRAARWHTGASARAAALHHCPRHRVRRHSFVLWYGRFQAGVGTAGREADLLCLLGDRRGR